MLYLDPNVFYLILVYVMQVPLTSIRPFCFFFLKFLVEFILEIDLYERSDLHFERSMNPVAFFLL